MPELDDPTKTPFAQVIMADFNKWMETEKDVLVLLEAMKPLDTKLVGNVVTSAFICGAKAALNALKETGVL